MIIAVWGSPGSGKTIMSMKIAGELAKKQKNVLVVTTDSLTPTMEILMKSDGQKSIGQVLDMQKISQDMLVKNCNVTLNQYISVIGYAFGENELSYTEITVEKGKEFFIVADQIADYVVVDCTSNVLSNHLTHAALLMADQVVYVHGSNLKAVAFQQANDWLLKNKEILPQQYISLMNNFQPYDPIETLQLRIGKMDYLIPNCKELYEQFIDMRLTDAITNKAVKKALSDLVENFMNQTVEKDDVSS